MTSKIALGLALFASTAYAQTKSEVSLDDVTEKQVTIVDLPKSMKSGKMKLSIKENTNAKTEEIVIDWKTMIYRLSKRNTELFKSEDKLETVVEHFNSFRTRKAECAEKEIISIKANNAMAQSTLRAEGGYVYDARGNIIGQRASNASINEVSRSTADLGHAQAAWSKEEEERIRVFGDYAKLAKGQKIRIYIDKHKDVTYCVLVEAEEKKGGGK